MDVEGAEERLLAVGPMGTPGRLIGWSARRLDFEWIAACVEAAGFEALRRRMVPGPAAARRGHAELSC
jgi:hypothetical protein